jgi:Bacterial Ig-like domain (group 1)
VRHGSKTVRLSKSDSRRLSAFRSLPLGVAITLVLGLLVLPVATLPLPVLESPASANGVPLLPGDVLASVGDGQIDNYSPAGTLNDTLNNGTNAEFTTGGCFDTSGDFFVTNFDSNSLSEFGPDGNLLNSTWATEPSDPESCTVNALNDVFVGGPGAPIIYEFDSSGALINSFNVQGGSGTGGTDWVNLEADQCTLLYTGQGSEILSYNVCTQTQNPDFATGLPEPCFELRVRPNGDVMVACASEVIRFNSAGKQKQTYTIPDAGELFSMNLDPDNSSFWTGDDTTGEVYHVSIASGSVLSAFSSAPAVGLFGLTLVGGINPPLATVTLSPSTQTLTQGQTATVTAKITNPGGPIAGQTVSFSVTGANTTNGSRKTDASGKTTFSYVGANQGQDTVTATFSSATGTATVTWNNSPCDTGSWPQQVSGVPPVHPNAPRGFYIGATASGTFSLQVAHHQAIPRVFDHFSGTITTDGSFEDVNAIMLEKRDTYSVSPDMHTLTFSFDNGGDIDGLSFVAMCGSTITFNLNFEGASAPTSLINLGMPSTNPSGNPFTFTRSD